MPRQTTLKTTTLYGAQGHGATVAEAKADAIRHIERAFDDPWDYVSPEMRRFPGNHIGLVYRTLTSWEYRILWRDEETKTGWHISNYATAADADRAMRRHLVQQYVDVLPDHGRSVLRPDDDEGRREHGRYVRFQHAYRRFQAQGHADHTCHRLACEAMDTPEPEEQASEEQRQSPPAMALRRCWGK